MPVCRKKADGPRWGHLVQDHHRDAVAREGDAVHHRSVEEAVRSPPGAPATDDCIARGDVTQELQRHHTAQSYPTGGGGVWQQPRRHTDVHPQGDRRLHRPPVHSADDPRGGQPHALHQRPQHLWAGRGGGGTDGSRWLAAGGPEHKKRKSKYLQVLSPWKTLFFYSGCFPVPTE